MEFAEGAGGLLSLCLSIDPKFQTNLVLLFEDSGAISGLQILLHDLS